MTHFVSASCDGNLCSVCKAPATHKLGEEIMHDEPCMSCGTSWKQVDDEIGHLFIPPPKGAEVCADWYHHVRGSPRHNLTAYVCCAHFTMIVGSASGCPTDLVVAGQRGAGRCKRNERCILRDGHAAVPDNANLNLPFVAEAGCTRVVLDSERYKVAAERVAHKLYILSEQQSTLFKDAVAIRDRALAIHGHGAPHSQLAMVVFDLAELVAAMARGDK